MNAVSPHPELADLTRPIPSWLDEVMRVPRRGGEVEVDGCPIRYLEWGDPRDPGVVMVHGFLAHARCLAFIAPMLARGRHVVAYDISGMGDSGARAVYAEDVRGREMFEVARHTGMFEASRPPVAIAHSYGCTVTFSAMEMFGEHFGGAILCDLMMLPPERLAAFRASSQPPGAGRTSDRPNPVYPDLASILARYRLSPEQTVEHPVLLEYIARHSVREVEGGWTWKFSPTIFANDHRDDDWWASLPARLRDLPVRNAFVYGGRSRLFDAGSVEWLRRSGVDRTTFVEVPFAHHHIMLDQPIAFAATLNAILEGWRT